MFKLISNLFKLVFLATIVISGIIALTPHNSNHYLAAAKDKRKLLYTAKSPKIILVGGSNVAFGIDSEKIKKHFSVPVINMGLHANLGLRFMMNEVKPALENGDIVIIFPEQELLNDDLDGRPEALADVIKYCPECVSGLSTPNQVLNAITGFLQLAESDILRILNTIKWGNSDDQFYNRKNFNQQGDFIGHLNQPSLKISYENCTRTAPHIHAIKLLNSFYQFSEPRNAQVYFIYPAIPQSSCLSDKKKNMAEHNLLSGELDIPILGTPQDFVFPDEYFYDTVYHLNAVGRDKRTDRIIELLSAVIEKQ